MFYVFTFNLPGYLPESEPAFFDTFEEAREAAAAELGREVESAIECFDSESEAGAREGIEFIEAQSGPFCFEASDGYVYTVTQGEGE